MNDVRFRIRQATVKTAMLTSLFELCSQHYAWMCGGGSSSVTSSSNACECLFSVLQLTSQIGWSAPSGNPPSTTSAFPCAKWVCCRLEQRRQVCTDDTTTDSNRNLCFFYWTAVERLYSLRSLYSSSIHSTRLCAGSSFPILLPVGIPAALARLHARSASSSSGLWC